MRADFTAQVEERDKGGGDNKERLVYTAQVVKVE